MNKNESGIYLITNKINGKKYVGSTHNFSSRWKNHISMLNRNVHFNTHLQNSWNKYGEDNFEFSILEKIEDTINLEDQLISREEYYIQKLDCINNGYNSRIECNTNYGVKWSEESKKRYSEYRKQHIVKEAIEALQAYSKTRIGTTNEAASNWYRNLSLKDKLEHNKKCTEGRIEASINRGYWHTEESYKKTVQTKKEKGLLKPISLYCLNGNLYKTYDSYSDCLREFKESNKNSSCLTNCINSGKLFHDFIVSQETSNFLPNYNEIVYKVNSNKSNLRYYQYSVEGEIVNIYKTKTEAARAAGLTNSCKQFSKAIDSNTIYKGYYWKKIEPISSDINSKSDEFGGSPEVDNTEPSTRLTSCEGVTTNS